MAARAGEDVAVTLFADVHYFYGPPTAKPPHHRFDKASYVYLFENASHRRARLEIANNAGTPEQDAFDGFVDHARVEYTYKQANLVTLIVDGSSRAAQVDTNQWHLPNFDPHNDKKYLYRLHTVDMYFYAKEDAVQFMSAIRRVLPSSQLQVEDEPRATQELHTQQMSPLVQNLEHVAISSPDYQNGQTPNSAARTTFSQPYSGSQQPFSGTQSSATSFPGPPAGAPSFPGPPTSAASVPSASAAEAQTAPSPFTYNPAAPAAPEVLRHREKTPPPVDGASNPLAAAAISDQSQQHFTPGLQQLSSHSQPSFSTGGYFSGPPQGSIGSLPPPPATSPPAQQSPYAMQYTHQLQQAQATNHAQSPGFPIHAQPPPQASPTHSIIVQSPPPQGILTPIPGVPGTPAGGFSNYSYTQPQTAAGNNYDVHNQVYKPTEGESKVKHHELPKTPRGKLENSAVKVEKGMTSFLKKLEKKIG